MPKPNPAGSAARQYSVKSPRQIARAKHRLPRIDSAQPIQNPGRRPSRANTMPAGIEAAITPIIWIAIGSVFSAWSTASAWPTSAAMMTCPAITAFINA